MKVKSYVGIKESVIEIEQPTDIYVLLDHFQSVMMEKSEQAKGSINVKKWENAANVMAELMEITEEKGFGSIEDVDKIKYL